MKEPTDNPKGHPVYRCELCECLVFSKAQTLTVKKMYHLSSRISNTSILDGIPKTIVHSCGGGSFGIARIVGIVSSQFIVDFALRDDDNNSFHIH